jgi:glycosyltransferase involved in cell wall biosynthesis
MGSPLRVLHVVVNMNRGGAETLIMNLYRNIDRSKVQFDFLTCKKGVFDPEILEMGGRIYNIPYVTEIGHSGYLKALNTFFKEHSSYQIVHSHLDKMSGLVLREARKIGVPIRIAHSHSTRSEGEFLKVLYKWYIGTLIEKGATHLFACSSESGEWINSRKSKRVNIINNGIDCDKFSFRKKTREKIRNDLNIDFDTFVIGHVGRFSHPKNHSFLINLFNEFIKLKPNSILLLVGDGELKPHIQNQILKYNIQDSVKFLGLREDIHAVLQSFDLFLFPSLYEGLPVTLIEAQASGVPCLISNEITKEVDMGVNLIDFLPLNNQTIWLEKINKISSEKYRKRPATSNVLRDKGFDVKETTKNVEKLYLSLVR